MSPRNRDDSDYRYRFLARFGSVILSGGIAAIPKALYVYSAELGLVPQEVWFVGYILAHRWTSELPFPSLRKMSVHTGVSYQMLHRYKNSLVEKGYLEIIPRTRPNGGRSTNCYDFSGLFSKLELLLIRDNGGKPVDLEGDDAELLDQAQLTTPGKPQFTDPRKPGLSGSGKRGTTGPDNRRTQHVNRTREQENPKQTDRPARASSGPGDVRIFRSSNLDARQIWAAVLMELRQHPEAQPHLLGSRIVGREGDEVSVRVASSFAAEWLQRRLSQTAARSLSSLAGEHVTVRFTAKG